MDGAEFPGIVRFTISVGATIVGPGKLCVDDPEQITTDGTPLQVWACDQTVAQSFATGAGTSVRVMGKCLAAVASKVVLRTCDGGPSQGWKVGSGELVNTGTGRCLDDPASGGEGTKLTVATCTGSAEQQWQMS
jgi:ricin-type beta-trefoil lectin protein